MVGRTCKAEECGRIWMSIKISHRVCDREQVPPSHLAHAHGSRCLRQNQILCPCSEKWLGFGRGGENAGRMNRSNYGWNRWCMPAIPCILPECKRPAVHFSPQTTSRPPRNRSIKFLYAQMNHHLALQFFKPPLPRQILPACPQVARRPRALCRLCFRQKTPSPTMKFPPDLLNLRWPLG